MDWIRLRWVSIGDVALAIVCFVSIRNVGGMILGLLLVALAIAAWAVTRLGPSTGMTWHRRERPSSAPEWLLDWAFFTCSS